MSGPPRQFSPSAAKMFRQCPRRWKHRYIDKWPDPPGKEALVGTFAHRVLEILCNEPAADRTLERARELAAKSWPATEANPDFRNLLLDNTAQRDFRWTAWNAIEALWELEDPATKEIISTETHVSTNLLGVPFRGVVDRLDETQEGTVVTDYKSGNLPPTNRRDESLDQVLLYAAALKVQTGEKPVGARLLYLGRTRGVMSTNVNEDNLNRATSHLAQTWSSLQTACETENFVTSTGPLCAWCPYVDRCPDGMDEVSRRASAGRLRSDAPARRLLGMD